MKNAKLPHFALTCQPFHLTYRLAGSLPRNTVQNLQNARKKRIEDVYATTLDLPSGVREEIISRELATIDLKYELAMDDALQTDSNGPYHLARPEVATVVLNSWRTLHEWKEIHLYAACVMSNHVHAVVGLPPDREAADTGKIIMRHKSYTARQCNTLLGTTGTGFWERTYFDRTVRRGTLETVIRYVLENPVRAGLVAHWQEWPHTFLQKELRPVFLEG